MSKCNFITIGFVAIILSIVVPKISQVLYFNLATNWTEIFMKTIWVDFGNSDLTGIGKAYVAIFFISGLGLTIYGSNDCEKSKKN
jgi:hypothetical protein